MLLGLLWTALLIIFDKVVSVGAAVAFLVGLLVFFISCVGEDN